MPPCQNDLPGKESNVMRIGKIFGRLLGLLFAASLVGCGKQNIEGPSSNAPSVIEMDRQIFSARGVIKELKPDGKTVVIRHEEIPNYMPAMTMPLEARNTNELKGLLPGETVTFNLIVTKTDAWIEQISKTDVPRIEEPPLPAITQTPPRPSFIHIMKDVEPLDVGDPLPEYHFTNQLGQPVTITQFRGEALAITFIFTRCPLPNFCPLMSANFGQTQDKLLALANGPTNWHLLTISFDADFDTSAVLKLYSAQYHCDPAHWSFVTGKPDDIAAICDQLGVVVERDPGGGFNHNLRTVVIDAAGRIQKIFVGNEWTSDELAAEMVKAAAKP